MTNTERKLLDNGYTFTGIYGSYKDKVQGQADKLRKEGYMVRVVFKPSSRYSRSRCGGYGVYSKPTKKKARELEVQRAAKERQRLNDLMSIAEYLQTKNRVELLELFKEAKGGELELLFWAKKKGIV